MDTASLLWITLFSSLGLAFFVYGKKQRKAMPLLCGMALMGYPYFVSNVILLVSIGIVLTAIPYFVRV
jgi:CHASE2 domain-containing sensor protein